MCESYLGLRLTNYSVGGYGFSSLQGSFQSIAEGAQKHDVYIVWASTNDIANNRPCGEFTDYTVKDDYSTAKLETQCGGINRVLDILKEKNPDAIVLFVSSCSFFSQTEGYILHESSERKNIYDYVIAQEQVCRYRKVPFFNLLLQNLFLMR